MALGFINNAALLLALGLLYDMLGFTAAKDKSYVPRIVSGIFLGAIGMAIMFNPWDFGQGVLFDTRSVLLCIAGFFFGIVPTLTALLMTAALRLFMGGAGALTGVAVIVSAGGIGLAWRHLRPNRQKTPSMTELYLLGLVVHAVMLLCMLTLPWEIAGQVLATISLPVMVIYPLTTAILGRLLVNRERRRQAEAILQASEDKFRRLFHEHSAVKLLIDPDTGSIAEANKAAQQFYGWSSAELKKMRMQDINTLTPEQVQAEMEKARTLHRVQFTFRHRRADGSIRDVEVYSSKVEISGKDFLHSIVHDVTDRVQAEEALRRREKFLQTILQTTPDGFWVLDSRGRITEVNNAYCVMSGYSRQEIVGMGISDLDATEKPTETAARIERIIKNGSEVFEARHRRKDGSIFPVEISTSYIQDHGGLFVCFCRDLSERKRSAEAVSHSNDLLRYIIEHANSAVAVHDKDLKYIYVSQNYLNQYQVSAKEIIGKHHYDIFPDLPQKWRDAHQKALAGQISRAERDAYVRADGSVEWTRWECRPWYAADASVGGFVVYTEVITERVQAEEALRHSEEYQRAMIAASPLAIISLSPDGRVKSWNAAAERIFGWTVREVMHQRLPVVTEDQRADFNTLIRRVLNGESLSNSALSWRHKNGASIEISLSTAPIRDSKRQITSIMAMLEDITAQKQAAAEKAKLQAQLIQAQKMESVGRLAGGVAHDYNNMLSVILGYTDLALEKLMPTDPLRPDLEEIMAAAARSADITRQLLAFSRQQTIDPRVLDLNATVESMLKMLRRLIGEDIDLTWHPNAGLRPVYMDPTQLDQILINLCVNARDAITDVGKITIETGDKRFDEVYCADHAGFVPGDFVLLAVSDNGCGMDVKTQNHLFEPFFTTKAMGKGTGLGLSTVYGIVKQNKGFINVYSEPGQGSTFRIYLPRHTAAPTAVKKRPAAAPDLSGDETILLVEDEPKIRRMTRKMLQRLGYTVLAAGTPTAAVSTAAEHLGRIHLLMTDVVMPEMNGRELSQRLQELYPGLKVLFMSGYTANVIAHHGVLDAGVHFIQKPFSKTDLAVRIRESLDVAA